MEKLYPTGTNRGKKIIGLILKPFFFIKVISIFYIIFMRFLKMEKKNK